MNGPSKASRRVDRHASVARLRAAGIDDLSYWSWKAVRRFIARRFGRELCRNSCQNYLHRLGFVRK